jgi:predicted dehydrogenase
MPSRSARGARRERRKMRYAVVGSGHIAQVAVLPAFANAKENSELAAIVSGDPEKRRTLGRKYRVPAFGYDQLEACLAEEVVDAVYIALPNDQHCEFTERAATAGAHVLCEKPMAVTSEECERMIRATEQAGVKLMVAYRLHFEDANVQAIQIAASGKIGTPRLFDSTFSMQVRDDNIRVEGERGGGPLYDIGVYCIQAARTVLGAEPTHAFALAVRGDDPRFTEVDEAVGAVLRFPGERVASFTCSFGASDVSSYRVVGTKGDLRVEPAYEYVEALTHHLTVNGRSRTRTFAKRDQFAPELIHFSRCILRDEEPEPSGVEGLIDVRIIEALQRSASTGAVVELPELPRERRPTPRQTRRLPPVEKPEVVHAESGSR